MKASIVHADAVGDCGARDLAGGPVRMGCPAAWPRRGTGCGTWSPTASHGGAKASGGLGCPVATTDSWTALVGAGCSTTCCDFSAHEGSGSRRRGTVNMGSGFGSGCSGCSGCSGYCCGYCSGCGSGSARAVRGWHSCCEAHRRREAAAAAGTAAVVVGAAAPDRLVVRFRSWRARPARAPAQGYRQPHALGWVRAVPEAPGGLP